MKKKNTRIGQGAPDLSGGAMNSEREAEAGRTPPRSANRTEKDRGVPTGPDAGRKPHELRTTSKTEFERKQEEKEGPLVARTAQEMSQHEELDHARRDDSDD